MFFDKRKFIMLFNPVRRILKEKYFTNNALNRNWLDSFRNKYCFRLRYAVFSISTSIALFAGYCYQNTNKKLSIKGISEHEIKFLSSISKNMIVINVMKGTKVNRNAFIKELIRQIKSEELNKLDIKIYYVEEDFCSKSVPNVSLYKGYGNIVSNIDLNFRSYDSIEKIKSFFIPKSENILNNHSSVVKNISYNTFENDVINASDKNNPLLLMYYDDYCLMCFLIRPLINSLANKLRNSTKIQFARYNIERNDLHELSPTVRATPTFVLFRGRQKPEHWDEYRPGDLINKIVGIKHGVESDICDNNELAELNRLEQNVFIRFQLFTILNIWSLYLMELQNTLISTPKDQLDKLNFKQIEDLLFISLTFFEDRILSSKNGANYGGVNLGKVISYDKIIEKHNFQEILLENVKKDMKRSDTIEENIEHLLDEIKGYCNDYLAIKSLIEKN
ncbi:uncharacterized protein cubi_01060 [Cryptosporidium ubiquitum]|uniref:Thioredoxin domain-containing protein n=1 Tax=Cryptosporidium ubiquitum TaxID=857276 RepID=A0A1J4MJ14_9CRYT|nr:uncharacterized protein cubi_01060 [Cryptosporidium ubiquitum]OII74216.1 hypothetical protein cubi_01060 [Cryptosporidium ubiquitum]